MPSQVLTKRRVKRRQQRLRLVSKNAKRKVRSVRKLRKTAKKVMRGGFLIGGHNVTVKLSSTTGNTNNEEFSIVARSPLMNSSKNLTIIIEIDLKKYTGSVLLLLNSLLTNLLGTPIELNFNGVVLDNINNNEKSKINDDINNSRDSYNEEYWYDAFTIDSKKMVTEPEIPKLKLPTQYEVVITLSQTDDGKTNIEKLSIPLLRGNRAQIYGIKVKPYYGGTKTVAFDFVNPLRPFWTYEPKAILGVDDVKKQVKVQQPISDTLAVIKQRINEIKEIDLTPKVDAAQVALAENPPIKSSQVDKPTLPEQDSHIPQTTYDEPPTTRPGLYVVSE